MGFLASDNVIECSATDLIGEYIGHTGPKVIQKLGEALGQVLFIDEAYRLGQGAFAKEAIDELVDSLTKPQYKGKMIVVLAGYEKEINGLLRVNTGLSSRFPEEIMFTNLSPEECLKLLIKKCQKVPKVEVNVGRESQEASIIMNVLQELSSLPGWGNGRDVETISKRIISHILKTRTAKPGRLEVKYADILRELERLKVERKARAEYRNASSSSSVSTQLPSALANPLVRHPPPPITSKTNTNAAARAKQEGHNHQKQHHTVTTEVGRDPGVPEHLWQQLQSDERHNRRLEAQTQAVITGSKAQCLSLRRKAQQLETEMKISAAKAAEDNEARRRHEVMRLQAVAAKRRAEEEAERLRRLTEEAEKQRQREAQAQQKLRALGVCCQGFRWIKQSSGYRCAGGSHFVGNGQLGM